MKQLELRMLDLVRVLDAVKAFQSEVSSPGSGVLSVHEVALSSEDCKALYDVLVTDSEIRDASKKLFVDGHYARAVEEAYKCLNNSVKNKSGCPADGADLMNQVFSEKSPVLRLNNLKTKSERDEQIGYMLIFGGCMTGIRNPRAHEHQKADTPEVALELLVMANHLMRTASNAKRARRRRKSAVIAST